MPELRLPEINHVVLAGRLTHDPERRYAADGTQVTTFTLAFNRHYRARDGHLAEHSGFVTVVTYQRLAEVCGERLHKASPVLVEGRLQMREWTAAQGAKMQRIEIRGEQVHFLDRAPGGASPEGAAPEVPDEDRLV